MNRNYISTTVFRRYLSLLAASGLKLPETVNIVTAGVGREFTVLHKIELNDLPQEGQVAGLIEPTMSITSWAVAADGQVPADDKQSWQAVNPELDWVDHGYFWVGKTERVYNDVNTANDKRLSGFGWCGNAERELKFPTFHMLTNGPLFTIQVRLSMLDLLATPTTVTVSATKVGSIEDDGTFKPLTGISGGGNGEAPREVILTQAGTSLIASATVHRRAEPLEPVIAESLRKDAPLTDGKISHFVSNILNRFPGKQEPTPAA